MSLKLHRSTGEDTLRAAENNTIHEVTVTSPTHFSREEPEVAHQVNVSSAVTFGTTQKV